MRLLAALTFLVLTGSAQAAESRADVIYAACFKPAIGDLIRQSKVTAYSLIIAHNPQMGAAKAAGNYIQGPFLQAMMANPSPFETMFSKASGEIAGKFSTKEQDALTQACTTDLRTLSPLSFEMKKKVVPIVTHAEMEAIKLAINSTSAELDKANLKSPYK